MANPAGKNPGTKWIESLEEKLNEGDILGVLRTSPALFRKAVAGASPTRPTVRKPGNDWTRDDILAHMLDAESVMTVRIRKMICEVDPGLPFFDQEKWIAALGPYRGKDPGKLAARFAALRAENVALLSALDEEQMKRTGVHPETGRLTLEELAARMARHDVNHLKQILAA